MKNKFVKWVKKNRKILYWPLVAVGYVLGIYLAFWFLPRSIIKQIDTIIFYLWLPVRPLLEIPFYIFEFVCKPIPFCENMLVTYSLLIILIGIEVGLIFYGIGYLFNRIKKRWAKIVFILLVILFIIFLMFLGEQASRISLFGG